MSTAAFNNFSVAEVENQTESRADATDSTSALFFEDVYQASPQSAEQNQLIFTAANYSAEATIIEANVRPEQVKMGDQQEAERFGKAFADIMLNKGRLEMDSPEGQLLFLSLHQAYSEAGEKGVKQIVDAINKNMNGEFEMSIVNDPVLTERVNESFKSRGETPPEYIRRLDMKDSKGRDRGGMILLHGAPDKEAPGTPI